MSDTPNLSAILDDLAAGRINAAEAARRIDSQHSSGADADPAGSELPTEPVDVETTAQPIEGANDFPTYSPPTADGSRTRSGTTKIDRVALRVIGRRVRIVAEPAVATVAVDGPHVLRRNGSVMEVSSDGEFSASIDGFQLLRTRRLDDFRAFGIGKELFVRVNPRLIVDAEVTGGSLTAENIVRLGRVRITAGSAKLTGVGQIEDAIVQAGQLTISGAICTGRSRVRAESGTLNIKLDDDSDVTVHGESSMGKINWSGGHSGAGDEVVMGEGRAKLDVAVVMGFASIKVGNSTPQDA